MLILFHIHRIFSFVNYVIIGAIAFENLDCFLEFRKMPILTQ